ncbi:MAG: hypothetical protein JW882_11735 [Deltaproteobacteria bacterium]|nr:hypothetical protein [Deltaproteobacteria bacterium]
MRLDLRFTKRPIEDLWCQAIIALVFQEEDMISGVLSNLDIKMAGALSSLARKKIWTGGRGEKTLLATELMVKPDKLLLYGLGNVEEYNRESLEWCIYSLAGCLDKMGINDFGIYVPVERGKESSYAYQLEIASMGLADFYLENHGMEPDFLLKIIFSVDERMMDIISQVEVCLREYFTPVLEFSILVDKKAVRV